MTALDRSGPSLRLGYNTNGLSGHRWEQALELMHAAGYRSVALTVDHHCLDPFSDAFPQELDRMQNCLARLGMTSVVETGARFLLDPRRKHEPTLVSPEKAQRGVRVDFLKRCIQIARALNSDTVSFWSGTLADESPRDVGFRRLVESLAPVIDYAGQHKVRLALEPEPGMVIQTFDDFQELLSFVDAPGFGLCVDIGHVHCLEPEPVSKYLEEWQDRIFTIHIEDMIQGVHEHLRFGTGTIEFRPILKTLQRMKYQGSLNVELSRHSHIAPQVLVESYQFLSRLMADE